MITCGECLFGFKYHAGVRCPVTHDVNRADAPCDLTAVGAVDVVTQASAVLESVVNYRDEAQVVRDAQKEEQP